MCDDTDDSIEIDEPYPWRDEQLMHRLYVEKGLTQYEIADALGCARSTVATWMAHHKIETRNNGPTIDAADILRDAEQLCELYSRPGMTTTKLADQLGCGTGTLSHWMNEHGIETGVRCHHEVGNDETYGKGWNRSKRESIRERDGYECQGCGLSQEEHRQRYWGESLHVHHIQKRSTFESDEEANAETNLVTLCRICHRKWEELSPLRPAP